MSAPREHRPESTQRAEVVLPGERLDATIEFFLELGFRLLTLHPAEEPSAALLDGHGILLALDAHARGGPGELRLPLASRADATDGAAAERELFAPNGTRVVLTAPDAAPIRPTLVPSLRVQRETASAGWQEGRAGMLYRDLIPERQGGLFIASHIRIAEGGPVPDYVHYHRVHFQLIYCRAGRVRVVYEDQGPPFWLEAGDCVLQPPAIRHRVLECSDGLEVIEVSSPALHTTFVEHELALPTAEVRSERVFTGQRFTRHVATETDWRHSDLAGFEERDLGLADPSAGVVRARVLRPRAGSQPISMQHDHDLRFVFLLTGSFELTVEGEALSLEAGDAVTLPAGVGHALLGARAEDQLLLVEAPC